jgi:hypothetical protein
VSPLPSEHVPVVLPAEAFSLRRWVAVFPLEHVVALYVCGYGYVGFTALWCPPLHFACCNRRPHHVQCCTQPGGYHTDEDSLTQYPAALALV